VEEGQVSACGVPCFARNVDELAAWVWTKLFMGV